MPITENITKRVNYYDEFVPDPYYPWGNTWGKTEASKVWGKSWYFTPVAISAAPTRNITKRVSID